MTNLERADEAVKPVAPFQTVEEEAEYWDTHSVVADITEDTEVRFHAPRKSDTLTVRFESADIERIREEASQRGVGPTTLVRMWVREHLHQRSNHPSA